jgi:hypothetical protein
MRTIPIEASSKSIIALMIIDMKETMDNSIISISETNTTYIWTDGCRYQIRNIGAESI